MWKLILSAMFAVFWSGCGASEYTARMDEHVRHHQLEDEPLVVLVDYSRSIYSKRLFLVNPKARVVTFSTQAGHARKSGWVYASDFSNVPDSLKSALGLYTLGREYPGKHGRSFKLHGESPTNSNAYVRHVVLHGDDSRYSSGCITVKHADMKRLLKVLKRGMKLIVYNSDTDG